MRRVEHMRRGLRPRIHGLKSLARRLKPARRAQQKVMIDDSEVFWFWIEQEGQIGQAINVYYIYSSCFHLKVITRDV
jgi:hypothetical protein